MKQIFSLTLIWALYSTAGALLCATCTDQSCSSTIPLTCSSEMMCITATIRATSSGTSVTQLYKACAASSLCPATGTSTFSVNLGFQSAIASAQCCNTDNCNSQTLPAPNTPAANSLQCIACDPTSQCTTPITCSGDETNCFSATLNDGTNTIPALGCASPNTCTAASGLGSLPFMQSVGSITSGPTCCTTSLCNNSSTTTTAAPTTTTTTATPPTTTTTTTTAAPTTTTTTTTTTSDASSFRLGFLHLLFVCLYL